MALALQELGFQTAIFRDSVIVLSPAEQALLTGAGIQVFEYGGNLNTEQAIFGAASDDLVQDLLNFAREERRNDAIDNNIDIKIPDLTLAVIRETFSAWEFFQSSMALNFGKRSPMWPFTRGGSKTNGLVEASLRWFGALRRLLRAPRWLRPSVKQRRGCMPDAADLFNLGNAAVVAPAGHGLECRCCPCCDRGIL